MWKVEFESAKVEREVLRLMQSGSISTEDRLVITAWIRQVSFEGPEAVRGDKRWADHELEDDWDGFRSSCYSNRGRIIYRVEEKVIKILIARITPDHNYVKEKKK
jgi:mRNA-degrading endonuclease YafQ of YafQ-DinJ toxin-antitoxin module